MSLLLKFVIVVVMFPKKKDNHKLSLQVLFVSIEKKKGKQATFCF